MPRTHAHRRTRTTSAQLGSHLLTLYAFRSRYMDCLLHWTWLRVLRLILVAPVLPFSRLRCHRSFFAATRSPHTYWFVPWIFGSVTAYWILRRFAPCLHHVHYTDCRSYTTASAVHLTFCATFSAMVGATPGWVHHHTPPFRATAAHNTHTPHCNAVYLLRSSRLGSPPFCVHVYVTTVSAILCVSFVTCRLPPRTGCIPHTPLLRSSLPHRFTYTHHTTTWLVMPVCAYVRFLCKTHGFRSARCVLTRYLVLRCVTHAAPPCVFRCDLIHGQFLFRLRLFW